MEDCGVKRETLGSRLGFLLLSVGCAVGLGNVWRFPFIVGQYGGGLFVLLYLFFLVTLGFPVLMMELAVGRAGRANIVGSYRTLANSNGKIWSIFARIAFMGNVILMMYYTTVSGWLFAYSKNYATGALVKCNTPEAVGGFFGGLLSSPAACAGYMLFVVAVGALLCSCSLRKSVENSVKYMMLLLFVLIAVLAVKALMMPGAAEGLKFYLKPDVSHFGKDVMGTIFAAMGQAFFTLSLGVGSMEIFGSYIGWKKSLAAESAWIIALDTLIAFAAGLIIFPICATYGVKVSGGPGLIFVSLPNVFNGMAMSRVWGFVFFAFLSLAALTTVVAVFENIIAFCIDEWKMSRRAAAALTGIGIALLSLPCAFGSNLLAKFKPFGEGSGVLDLEDFIVSQNLLPLGALMTVFFCSWACGWGSKKFFDECEIGQQWRFPGFFRAYCKWVLPLIIIVVFVVGYWQFFGK